MMLGQSFTITNPNSIDVKDAPVVIELNKYKNIGLKNREKLAVNINGKQVCSQLDDLNNDSVFDELVFITDLKAGEKKKISIKKISDKKRINCKQEAHTQLLLKESDGSIKSVSEVSSNKNDMYNKLHHHGVAFESVSDWVGVGSLKGFENDKMTHINKFDKRTQRIVSQGNIRTIVESQVEGWEYEGKKIDITIRYIIYARHCDVIAEVTASEDIQTLATGVQQIGGGQCFQSNQLIGSWGSWHPQPDKGKYPKETVGLGLYLPKKHDGKQIMDGVNNLITFPYKKGEVLRFYFTTIAAKEELNTIENADEFFKYLNTWRRGLETVIVE
ncbi:DUF4861 domain-containing protein [Paludibacter sp.]